MQTFQREIIRDISVITIKIETLDSGNADQVTGCLTDVLRGENRAVLDLGDLRYCDVRGFAAILKLVAGSIEGQDFRLCSQSGTIQALFELLRAETVVQLYQSREEALTSLMRPALHEHEAAHPIAVKDRKAIPSARGAYV